MTFLDLFAGIGGFRLGMEQVGHQCIGFCEIDEFARRSYKAIHDTRKEVEMHDITSISDEFVHSLGPVDILCGGFPCQAFSIAGKRQGFSDTRGTLFFEIARFATLLQPKLLFLRTSGDCSITKEGLRSRRSSERWMDWGMMWNGKCLTQRPTFPKAVSGSSLSDILETHVPNKYFLSLDRLQHLIKTSETC